MLQQSCRAQVIKLVASTQNSQEMQSILNSRPALRHEHMVPLEDHGENQDKMTGRWAGEEALWGVRMEEERCLRVNEMGQQTERVREGREATEGGPACRLVGPTGSEGLLEGPGPSGNVTSQPEAYTPRQYLWSGFGFPFFLMLFAVVSLKCNRPSVTLVTWSANRSILKQTTKISRDCRRTQSLWSHRTHS